MKREHGPPRRLIQRQLDRTHRSDNAVCLRTSQIPRENCLLLSRSPLSASEEAEAYPINRREKHFGTSLRWHTRPVPPPSRYGVTCRGCSRLVPGCVGLGSTLVLVLAVSQAVIFGWGRDSHRVPQGAEGEAATRSHPSEQIGKCCFCFAF